MTKERAAELAHSFFQNKITDLEETELHTWYKDQLEGPFIVPKNFARSKREHSMRMLKFINSSILIAPPIRLWLRVTAAAAVLLMTIGAVFYFSWQDVKPGYRYSGRIFPAKNGATLTLASGQQLELSEMQDGKIADQTGISVTKTAGGQLIYRSEGHVRPLKAINTLRTAKGQTYVLVLPDGSKIWMNAASSLIYAPGLIENGLRIVRLEGEAYFEISKDKDHPFVVRTENQEVRVMGTHFNISSYRDEGSVRTTLLEGSVQVKANRSEIMLKPNQQSVLSAQGLAVIPVLAQSYTNWKDGFFQFKKEDLRSVMRKVSRWYDVEIEYWDADEGSETFSGTISRSDEISTVLRTLERSTELKFKIEDRKVTVFH